MYQNPTTAYTGTIATQAPARTQPAPAAEGPALLLVMERAEAEKYLRLPFRRLVANATADAVARISRERPRIVVIDWDLDGLDAGLICRNAASSAGTSVLVTTGTLDRVPAILKAGSHAVLLKPFPPNLFAARLGRLLRDRPLLRSADGSSRSQSGTNRFWAGTSCPHCHVTGVTSFDFSSYRRMWYACLACDAVWLGTRQE
jgi:DNA-binding response OmpR family regulator